MVTPRGTGQIHIRGNRTLGPLDHDFHDPHASWTVAARVVANGEGCEFPMTFFQPSPLDGAELDRQALQIATELANLRDPRDPLSHRDRAR